VLFKVLVIPSTTTGSHADGTATGAHYWRVGQREASLILRQRLCLSPADGCKPLGAVPTPFGEKTQGSLILVKARSLLLGLVNLPAGPGAGHQIHQYSGRMA
jgi:hypothetical protein